LIRQDSCSVAASSRNTSGCLLDVYFFDVRAVDAAFHFGRSE